MFTCSEIRTISLNRQTRVQLHSYLLSSSYKGQIWQFRRHACLLTSCWSVYCAFKQIQALLKIQEKWHMHSFFKQANCLHNHNIQLHNLGIWYLEWVSDEELFLPVLFYTPTQANRACPDVINWSISANNTAQTHHYTKSISILLFKAISSDLTFSSFVLKPSIPLLQWLKTAGDALSDISCLVMDSWTGEKKMIYCSTCRDSH